MKHIEINVKINTIDAVAVNNENTDNNNNNLIMQNEVGDGYIGESVEVSTDNIKVNNVTKPVIKKRPLGLRIRNAISNQRKNLENEKNALNKINESLLKDCNEKLSLIYVEINEENAIFVARIDYKDGSVILISLYKF